jgi:hypothetical protein
MADDMDLGESTKGEIEPHWSKKFNPCWIKEIVKASTDNFLRDHVYNAENVETNAVNAVLLSRRIRDILKEANNRMERYKINVQCYLGEKRDQKVVIVAKGYWDNYLDNYVTYTFHGDGFYCTVIVWGFYTD